jgi:hypothetical protein
LKKKAVAVNIFGTLDFPAEAEITQKVVLLSHALVQVSEACRSRPFSFDISVRIPSFGRLPWLCNGNIINIEQFGLMSLSWPWDAIFWS